MQTNWQPTASIEQLRQRATLIAAIRQFFAERQVMEVDTPAMSHATVTDIHLHTFQTEFVGPGYADGSNLFFMTSPEFHMKRLLAAGSGCIYQINKAFRNEENGRYHNPEFTMLEWYRVGFDHHKLMDEMDDLLQLVLKCGAAQRMAGLEQALAQGAHVFYADHHKAGDVPQHGNLDVHIDLDANMCTALIVDKLLEGRFHTWAITAAYGDNLIAKADALADQAGLNNEQKAQLKELGTLINYNGYGSKVDDLHFHPADLYRALVQYISPFEVIEDKASPYYQLQSAYQQDMLDDGSVVKARQHRLLL